MFVYLKAIFIFLLSYYREYARLLSMCRRSLKKTGGMETADLVLIWMILVPVFIASPLVLLYTSYHRTKRWVSIYGKAERTAGDVSEGDA